MLDGSNMWGASPSMWGASPSMWGASPSMCGASPGYMEMSYEPSFLTPMPSYESTGPAHEMTREPQVQWWVKKVNQHNDSTTKAYQLRSVGSMRPTNLGPTQPKGCRNKAREQRKKHADARDIPDVPRGLQYPSEMELAIRLADLEAASMDGHTGQFWTEIRDELRQSFERALKSVNHAARAYEDLCAKTQKLKEDPQAMETVKLAKMHARDIVLRRWFGLTAWIYNQAESEFFQSYGKDLESQLMNGVVKIRQRLMQNLMRRPCWHKLEKLLVQCAAEDSLTPELQGLLNRFHFTIESLGGLTNPVLQQARLTEEEEKLMEIQDEKAQEQAAEQDFEAQVWDNAVRKVSESVVGFLGIDASDDFDLRWGFNLDDAGTHDPLAMDAMGAFDEVDGDPSFAAFDVPSPIPQSTSWDQQYPNGQLPAPAFS